MLQSRDREGVDFATEPLESARTPQPPKYFCGPMRAQAADELHNQAYGYQKEVLIID